MHGLRRVQLASVSQPHGDHLYQTRFSGTWGEESFHCENAQLLILSQPPSLEWKFAFLVYVQGIHRFHFLFRPGFWKKVEGAATEAALFRVSACGAATIPAQLTKE